MRRLCWIVGPLVLLMAHSQSWAQDLVTTGPLHGSSSEKVGTVFPSGTHMLLDALSIEEFLKELDESPPDWPAVYGHGHHDPGHDDRLFDLNRKRDAKREGRAVLSWHIAFAWLGELSNFDDRLRQYAVSLGPKFVSTAWGVVRFKPEDVPANLRVTLSTSDQERLRVKQENGSPFEIEVIMSGRLVPDESIVYDFSHEEEGRGLIMPVVRIEQIAYFSSQ